MWKLYDILLEGMEKTETVEDFLIGPRWAVVKSSSGSTGIAPVIVESRDRFDFSFSPETGMPLKEMAEHLKSWNLMEASLALAAVNAYYNFPRDGMDTETAGMESAAGSGGEKRRVLPGGRRVRKAFQTFCQEHTAEGMTLLAEPVYNQEELSELPGRKMVLRKETETHDYFYTAYRELVPEADRLILSGRSLVDKTAGLMYEHAVRNKTEVYFFGPDVPLCPAFRQHGVQGIWSLTIDRTDELMRFARAGMTRDSLLRTGHYEVLE